MPLANYITEFMELSPYYQAQAVLEGKYNKSQLESLNHHAVNLSVVEKIEIMLNHGELDLPEAVTPQPIARQESKTEPPVRFSLDFESLTAHMNYRYEILTNPSRSQSRALVELGFMVLLAKRELDHGELTSWIKENTNVSERWAQFSKKSAEQFIEQHGERPLLMLCNPDASTDSTDRVLAEQQMMDFTGGKGPSALLHELGIKKQSKSTPKAKPLREGETQAHHDACELLYPTMDQLREYIIGKRRIVQHFDLGDLKTLQGDLIDAKQVVDDLIKAG